MEIGEGVRNETSDSQTFRSGRLRGELLAELVERQDGAVSLSQLRELGVGDGAVKHWVQCRRLHRMHRSVYAVGNPRLTKRGRLWAAYLATDVRGQGADGVIGAWSAADMLALRPTDRAAVDVMVPRKRRSTSTLKAHVVTNLAPRDVCRDIDDHPPCTNWARTALDIAAVTDRARTIEKLLIAADVQRVFDMNVVEDLVARNRGHHGLKTFNEALHLYLTEPLVSESPLEDDFVEFIRTHDLPRPLMQYPLGPYRYDAAFPQHNLLVELDGARYHSTLNARRTDPAKTLYAQQEGFRLERLTHWDVNHDRYRTLARLNLSRST